MINYGATLYGPNYLILGVPATLTLPGTDGEAIELTALDKTAGVEVGGNVEVMTVAPGAVVRRSEIADVDLSTLRDATLLMNGVTWTVRNHMLKPSPKGEADGEVVLLLEES